MRPLLVLALVGLASCSEEDAPTTGGEVIPLLRPFELAPVPAGADPLASHQPAVIACPAATWGPEGGGFEIQTGACNYATFDQSLPVAIEAGDEVAISIWHDFLDAPEPSTAHVAVLLGDQVIWETTLAIPAPSAAFDVVVPIASAPAPDARLGVHLHNHGFNSWRIVAIDLLAATPR